VEARDVFVRRVAHRCVVTINVECAHLVGQAFLPV
jgi:hypothetical protein